MRRRPWSDRGPPDEQNGPGLDGAAVQEDDGRAAAHGPVWPSAVQRDLGVMLSSLLVARQPVPSQATISNGERARSHSEAGI